MSIRRWISLFLFCLSIPAAAEDCLSALLRFDYEAAASLAKASLVQNPADDAARLCVARAAYETGHFEAALDALRAVERHRQQGELRTYAYNWLTVTLRRLGRDAEAMQYGRAALAWARIETNQQNLATALHNMAGLLWSVNDAAGALSLYRESIPLNPDLSERSASFNNVGLIYQALGQYSEAENWIGQAIALNREHGHFHHLGKHLMNLGNLYREEQRFPEAAALLEEGASSIDRAGDLYWQAVAARYRAWLARDQGDRAVARQWLEQAVARYAAAGATLDAASTREELRVY